MILLVLDMLYLCICITITMQTWSFGNKCGIKKYQVGNFCTEAIILKKMGLEITQGENVEKWL